MAGQAEDNQRLANINAYCLFCRTGDEQKIVEAINQRFPDLLALAPLKILPEKRRGKWEDRARTLLPGYIFVFCAGQLPHDLKRKTHNLYKILQYERGIRTLTGPDADYAMWLHRHHGKIATSKILSVGKTVQVIDGPLQDFAGRIVRLDKHKRRAWIEFDFDGHKRTISIGAECLDEMTGSAEMPPSDRPQNDNPTS